MRTAATGRPPTADGHALATHERAELVTPSGLGEVARRDVAAGLNGVLADVYALYFKTKNFHWHMSGPHFRDYHRLLSEQADQLIGITDALAERVRKIGATTLRSVGHVSRLQHLSDNDAPYVDPLDILAELREDNLTLRRRMHNVYGLCEEHGDIASANVIAGWIDEAETRAWFLYESSRHGDPTGH